MAEKRRNGEKQTAPSIRPKGLLWSETESNCRHEDFQSSALPTELSDPFIIIHSDNIFRLTCRTRLSGRDQTKRLKPGYYHAGFGNFKARKFMIVNG